MTIFLGTPTSIAGPTDCLDVNDGNLNSDQFLCFSIDGTTINAVINTVLVSTSTTPHGGTKVRAETVNTSNMALDDFELFRIRDPDCPHCTGEEPVGEECEICENADEDRPNEVLPELLVTIDGLADKFTDDFQWTFNGHSMAPTALTALMMRPGINANANVGSIEFDNAKSIKAIQLHQ